MSIVLASYKPPPEPPRSPEYWTEKDKDRLISALARDLPAGGAAGPLDAATEAKLGVPYRDLALYLRTALAAPSADNADLNSLVHALHAWNSQLTPNLDGYLLQLVTDALLAQGILRTED